MRRFTPLAGSMASRRPALVARHQDHHSSTREAQNARRLIVRIRAASFAILLTAFATLAVTGCTTQGVGTSSPSFDPQNPGTVMGGLTPITGSSIQLYAVDAVGTSDQIQTLLPAPILTNNAGGFSVWGKFTCPDAASQIYLLATGGNPGFEAGTNNSGIVLLSALGPCSKITATTPFIVNEVTTVASTAALAPYLTGTTSVTEQANTSQLQSAFQLAANFSNAATGTAPGTAIPAGYTVPASTINTLANLLSTCVYSRGGVAGDGSPCGNLYAQTTLPGVAAPSATLAAIYNILTNPKYNVDGIYSLVKTPAVQTLPFQPQLDAPPPTWSIDLIGEAATPVITSQADAQGLTITLSDAYPTAAIYYTLDGSTPSATSTRYTAPFSLNATATVKAVAVVGTDLSSVATQTLSVTPVATRLVFLTQPHSVLTTGSFDVSLALEDSAGNIVVTANQPVSLSLQANPSGATLGGTLIASPVNGVVSFSSLWIPTAASGYTLAAQATGLPPSISNSFEVSLPYPDLPSVQASSASAFVSSVGINTHFNYYGSIYTNNTPLMIQRLQALGITHLRDGMCWQGPESWNTYYVVHQQLAGLGFKTDFVTYYNQSPTQIAAYPALVTDAEAVEPANEYDVSGDPNWAANIKAQQKILFNTIKASPYASSITVLAPSLAYQSDAGALGNVDAVADAGNLHGYFSGYNPGNAIGNPAILMDHLQPESPGQPVWVTETGYFAQPGPFDGAYGVDLATQAVYIPRTLLEYFNAGVPRTYLYELADDLEPGQNPANYHWGLLDSAGNPKPAFNAVAHLLTTLADPQTPVLPSALAFQLENASTDVHHALFQKHDGTFYLALWVEAASYNFLTQQTIAVPAQHINLQLNVPLAAAQSIHWDSTGATAVQTLNPSQSIPLVVDDKLQIVQLTLKQP
jgi:hypothetical protein